MPSRNSKELMATPKLGSISGRAGYLVNRLDTLVARRWGRGTHPDGNDLDREIAISFNRLCELLGSHDEGLEPHEESDEPHEESDEPREKSDEPHEKVEGPHEKSDESRRAVACCRMLGNCNGRTDFGKRNTLDWASDGSLDNYT